MIYLSHIFLVSVTHLIPGVKSKEFPYQKEFEDLQEADAELNRKHLSDITGRKLFNTPQGQMNR